MNIRIKFSFLMLAAVIGAIVVAGCQNSADPSAAKNNSDTSKQAKTDTTQSRSLELVFADSTYQITGVAKAANRPLLVNYPRWSDVYRWAVAEVTGDTGVRAFPDEKMNRWNPGEPAKDKLVCVQSVYYDEGGTLWILDPAAPRLKTIQGHGAKLVKMKRNGNAPERTYSFTGIVPDTAYVNDVRVDVQRNYAYLTESKGGGIIVADLQSGKMRRVLSNHYSVKSDPAYKYIIDGHELIKEGKPAKFNSDGIALTPDGTWLYYKPLTDDKLYRIKTESLRDWKLSDTALGGKVEDLGHFASTDGMIFDKAGNLYLGDPQHYRMLRIAPDHHMTTLIEDPRLIWPDSYAIAEGYLYISCSQIQKQPDYNNGVNKRTSPYTVYRMKL